MAERFHIGKIAILGPGLIGGSLLLACRRYAHDAEGSWQIADQVAVYDRCEKTREAIRQSGLIGVTVSDSPAEAVRGAEMVFLTVPVGHMPDVVRQALPALSPQAIVTDVGSVKGTVVAELEPLLAGKALWVGGHPMTGREKGGFEAASDNLFDDATVIVTPTAGTDPAALARVKAFWAALGCRLEEMSPLQHDQRTARFSHINHLAAAALSNLAQRDIEGISIVGSGFRDTTRIAASSAEMWNEIYFQNRTETLRVFDELLATLGEARQALAENDTRRLYDWLKQANELQRLLPRK